MNMCKFKDELIFLLDFYLNNKLFFCKEINIEEKYIVLLKKLNLKLNVTFSYFEFLIFTN